MESVVYGFTLSPTWFSSILFVCFTFSITCSFDLSFDEQILQHYRTSRLPDPWPQIPAPPEGSPDVPRQLCVMISPEVLPQGLYPAGCA